MILKIKPVYNFQSVECEVDYNPETDDLSSVFDLYENLLAGLIKVSQIVPNGPKTEAEKPVANVEPATSGQIAILKRYHIPYKNGISKYEAGKLIETSIQNQKSFEDDF